MKFINFLCTFILIVTSGCHPEDPTDYDEWDVNHNDTLSNTEFYTAYRTLGYYDKWDLDGDGHLDAEEWEQGMQRTFPRRNEEYYNKFEGWDMNADGWLSKEEFIDNSFSTFDTNNDSIIDRKEFKYWFQQRK